MDSDQKIIASASGDASVIESTVNDQIQVPVDAAYEEADIEKNMKDLGQETKALFTAWGETLSDCEKYEKFSLQHLDSLIKEALALETELKRQKENLRQRLVMIMGNLRAV